MILFGEDVTIDGDTDGDGAPDVTLDTGMEIERRHFDIDTGARLTLESMTLVGGRARGSDGQNGIDGPGDFLITEKAANGSSGRAGLGAEGASIINDGSLTLVRSEFDDDRAVGGLGGAGGDGAKGTDGTPGADGSGRGNPGRTGGDGGAGGDIVNAPDAKIVILDTVLGPDSFARGGAGGQGGDGGDGGNGGRGGEGALGLVFVTDAGDGGPGGDGAPGGDAGDAGRTGFTTHGIFNRGTPEVVAGFASAAPETSTATLGSAGEPGRGGAGGQGGQGGPDPDAFGSLSAGRTGATGEPAADGDRGFGGFPTASPAIRTIGGTDRGPGTDTLTAPDTAVFLSRAQDTVAGDTLVFSIHRAGALDQVLAVECRVTTGEGALVAADDVLFGENQETPEPVSLPLGGPASGKYLVELTGLEPLTETEDTIVFGTSRNAMFAPDAESAIDEEAAREVAYLYEAALDRNGDIDLAGLNFWIETLDFGLDVFEISQSFLTSPEFVEAFGNATDPAGPDYLTDGEYIDILYENVLERGPDGPGFDFWVGELAIKTRAEVLHSFATVEENTAESPFVAFLEEVSDGLWDFIA